MSINDLKEGMEIKNYKVFCEEYLHVKPQKGNGREAHYKTLSRYCKYHKEGRKIIIDKVYETPKEKVDLRKTNGYGNTGNFKRYKELNIEQSKWNNIGIYFILKDNDIYIGSTIKGFRERFKDHYYGYFTYMQHTYKLLQDGGEFNILYDMTGIEDEVLVRMVEQKFIKYFINNPNYNVINRIENTFSNMEKYKTIKIQEDKYEQALQLLIDNGLLNSEEYATPTNNYILNSIFDNFDIKNMPF